MAPMAVIKAHLPCCLPTACASGLRLKLGPVAREVVRSTAGFALFDRQSQGIAPGQMPPAVSAQSNAAMLTKSKL